MSSNKIRLNYLFHVTINKSQKKKIIDFRILFSSETQPENNFKFYIRKNVIIILWFIISDNLSPYITRIKYLVYYAFKDVRGKLAITKQFMTALMLTSVEMYTSFDKRQPRMCDAF